MSSSNVSAFRYPADLYAAVHSGNEGDVDFYRRVARGAATVLELGCGWGRIATAIAADGAEVVAVDADPELLALAPPSAVTFVEGDVRSIDLDRAFDRVIAPYNVLYCLPGEADVLALFTRAREHLLPSGYFVFDAWSADAFHADADPNAEDDFEVVKTVDVRGTTWDVFERSDWHRAERRIDAHYRHVPRDGRGEVMASITQRYVLSTEVPPLLERAGLELVALLGAFDDEAYDPEESEFLIGIARPLTPSTPRGR